MHSIKAHDTPLLAPMSKAQNEIATIEVAAIEIGAIEAPAVSSLPDEILCHIFCLAVASPAMHTLSCSGHLGSTNRHTYSAILMYKLVGITRVCRAWRRLTLDYPRFWSNAQVVTCSELHFETVVQRCRDFPVSLRAYGSPDPDPLTKYMDGYVRLYIDRCARRGISSLIGELHLSMGNPISTFALLQTQGSRLAQLRSLDLECSSEDTKFSHERRQGPDAELQEFLSTRPPLEHLQLQGFFPGWGSISQDCWPSRLVSLVLTNTQTTAMQFFDLVELSSHTLRAIAFGWFVRPYYSGPFPECLGTTKIQLERLEELVFLEETAFLSAFYARFAHPIKTSLDLRLHAPERPLSHEDFETAMLSEVMAIWGLSSASSLAKPRQASLLRIDLQTHHARANHNYFNIVLEADPSIGFGSFRLSLPPARLDAVFSLLSLPNVTKLFVQTSSYCPIAPSWRLLFSRQPYIQEIETKGTTIPHLIKALGPAWRYTPQPLSSDGDISNTAVGAQSSAPLHDDPEEQIEQLPLPLLRSLTLRRILLSTEGRRLRPPYCDLSSLIDTLIDRCNYSVPLTQINVDPIGHEMDTVPACRDLMDVVGCVWSYNKRARNSNEGRDVEESRERALLEGEVDVGPEWQRLE